MPVIRRAVIGDAHPLAVVAERTFRDTFGAENTAENMNAHCRKSYCEAIQAREITESDRVTLLACANGQIIGFAQIRWGAPPECVVAAMPSEIQRLYVDKAWHGQGVAQDLMTAGLREIQDRGSDAVWLGVWEHNPRAISFYRKFGFLEVGAHVFSVGNDPQRDIIMARQLAQKCCVRWGPGGG